jgi:peptidyl-tRNA hydrolase, PTH1 family
MGTGPACMENEHLIVGLGNPGREYERTRHNAGFMVVERLSQVWKLDWTMERKFSSRMTRLDRDGRRVWLCQPQTYMNLSGEAVGAFAAFRKIAVPQVLVVVDDADLPLGQIRMRPRGTSGGHHGLESIEQHLATTEYARQRVGIGRQDSSARQIAGHVLGQFGTAEAPLLEKILETACAQVECWLSDGVAVAMNRFNGAVKI